MFYTVVTKYKNDFLDIQYHQYFFLKFMAGNGQEGREYRNKITKLIIKNNSSYSLYKAILQPSFAPCRYSMDKFYCLSHFRVEETEAQRSEMTAQLVRELGCHPWPSNQGIYSFRQENRCMKR